MPPTEINPQSAIRKLNVMGLATVGVLIFVVGGWAYTSELTGAVIAGGTVIVESNVKKVQHPTGGVVKEILVREGTRVEENQVLIRLDDTVTRSTLGVVQSQLDELRAREGRLLAEREGAESLTFPADLLRRRAAATADLAIVSAMNGEETLFESRKEARKGQRAQLRERAAQIAEEIRGQTAQQQAKHNEIELIEKELVGVTDLYKKNLVSISRFMQLQRDQARLHGDRGQFVAEIAKARGRIAEIELQILQLDQDFRTEVLKDLRDSQGKIAELSERVVAAEDQLKRIDIRAPRSGYVNQLAVHTVGGVVANGEMLMQIVPESDQLIIEAKVAPQDVDQLELKAPALVRIMAGNQRTMPDLNGSLSYISADLTRDPSPPPGQAQMAYFLVRVSLPASELERMHDFKLLPGMPAEVFIQTHSRTPLSYLLKPLYEQIARTFRER